VEALLKWVDDFVFFCYPHINETMGLVHFLYNASLIWEIADKLSWPWAVSKCIDFSNVFPYVGFIWDINSRIVYLSGTKCAKFLKRLHPWTKRALVTREDCDIMIGTLNHCALVVSDGRSRLPSLYGLSASFHG
jgi:hypothetical protein